MTWVILTPMFQRLDGGYYVMFFAFIAADTMSNFVNVSADIYAWLERFISLEDQAIE